MLDLKEMTDEELLDIFASQISIEKYVKQEAIIEVKDEILRRMKGGRDETRDSG